MGNSIVGGYRLPVVGYYAGNSYSADAVRAFASFLQFCSVSAASSHGSVSRRRGSVRSRMMKMLRELRCALDAANDRFLVPQTVTIEIAQRPSSAVPLQSVQILWDDSSLLLPLI